MLNFLARLLDIGFVFDKNFFHGIEDFMKQQQFFVSLYLLKKWQLFKNAECPELDLIIAFYRHDVVLELSVKIRNIPYYLMKVDRAEYPVNRVVI